VGRIYEDESGEDDYWGYTHFTFKLNGVFEVSVLAYSLEQQKELDYDRGILDELEKKAKRKLSIIRNKIIKAMENNK
jgi:hypothetical protein